MSSEKTFESWQLNGLYNAPALLLKTTPSTHTEMRARFKELAPGALIVADAQDAGRGRHERKWYSPAGKNLYFNLLYPLQGIPLKTAPQLMQITAITLANIFSEVTSKSISVKWPNDVWFEGQKLCGMVSEILVKSASEMFMSIGIGINVNVTREELNCIDRPTTSLSILKDELLDREALLRRIVPALETAVEKFRAQGLGPWIQSWRAMDCFIGKSARIVEFGNEVHGTVLGISDDGSLQFQKETGETISIYSGDLEI